MTEETLVITKDGWKLLRILSGMEACKRYGKPYKQPTDEQLERQWKGMRFRNAGASNIQYPIADDEYRYCPSGGGYSIDTVKVMLAERGLTYRQDGFIAEFLYA